MSIECFVKTLLIFLSVLYCLRDVALRIEPRVVRKGEEATLTCTFDLENSELYTVKWYWGKEEFYRYTPKEHPRTIFFPFGAIDVNVREITFLQRKIIPQFPQSVIKTRAEESTSYRHINFACRRSIETVRCFYYCRHLNHICVNLYQFLITQLKQIWIKIKD